MARTNLKELQAVVRLFEKEVLFNPAYEELDIQSIFIDHKEKIRRAIILIEENVDILETEKLTSSYFKDYSYKVVSLEGRPEGTASINTGNGIRHHNGDGWGTLGGIFSRKDDSNLYGLSNNHVVAKLNSAQAGDEIIYSPNVQVGTLFRWIIIKHPPKVNRIDAALFKIDPKHNPSWIPDNPQGSTGPKINMNVYKNGYTTQITRGYIKSYNGSSKVVFDGQTFHFSGIIAIKGDNTVFNMPGDSGSVVFTSSGNRMVGLVFAKYHDYCWALPISGIKPLLL